MDPIEQLTEHFRKFPGIGARQAKRFVYFLLTRDKNFLNALSSAITTLQDSTAQCSTCMRFYTKTQSQSGICSICSDPNRDSQTLMILEKDVDLANIEQTQTYSGYYFILGGTIPLLSKEPERHIRAEELKKIIASRSNEGLKEIILALSANPDGDNTTKYVSEILAPALKDSDITISVLGRGLSSGTELEYSDPETIKNAFVNRLQQ